VTGQSTIKKESREMTFEEYQAAKATYQAAKAAYESVKAEYELANGPAWQSEIMASDVIGDDEGRKESLKLAFELGATEKTCRKILTAAKVARDGGTISIATRYGSLSRGKCWGRNKKTDEWADKSDGTVYLTPGRWMVGSSDGFSRKEKAAWKVEKVSVGEQEWLIAN